MLWTTNSSTINKLISADRINKVDEVKMMEKHSNKKSRTRFFTSGAKLTFAQLRQPLIITPTFYHFDPKYHIWIKSDISGHAICAMLS